MAALGKRKAVKSPSPSSSSSEGEEEEAVNGNNEGASGSEELDSDLSTDSENELNTSSDSEHSSQPSQVSSLLGSLSKKLRSNSDMSIDRHAFYFLSIFPVAFLTKIIDIKIFYATQILLKTIAL